MGYSTQFKGKLKFTTDIPLTTFKYLQSILGEDCRDHPEWNAGKLTYIDLQVTDDFEGIEWNGSEKTYDLVDKINLIIKLMKEKYPKFGLTGELLAQGEDIDDRWILKMEDNIAIQKEIVIDDGNKCYIIVEDSWEYNDEYYYQPKDESYILHENKLFTKTEALKICEEMNSKCSLTRYDDWEEKEVKIKPYHIIKIEI